MKSHTRRRRKTERITRRDTLREVRPFRVYGQHTRSRVYRHVHKSSLPEEENKVLQVVRAHYTRSDMELHTFQRTVGLPEAAAGNDDKVVLQRYERAALRKIVNVARYIPTSTQCQRRHAWSLVIGKCCENRVKATGGDELKGSPGM